MIKSNDKNTYELNDEPEAHDFVIMNKLNLLR